MPNRIIKESICTSDTVDCLSWFEEVFFYRLMVNVDDYGRLDARPAILKARMFPLKTNVSEKTIAETLSKLESAGLLRTYSVNEKLFLALITWSEHQTIRNLKSKYPSPDDADNTAIEINCKQMQADASKCPRNPIQSESNPIQFKSKSNPIAFDRFWTVYPKKTAKAVAKKAFDKIAPDDALLDTMIKSVESFKKTQQWLKDDGQYIPNPTTWLNQRRWEDELPQQDKPKERKIEVISD